MVKKLMMMMMKTLMKIEMMMMMKKNQMLSQLKKLRNDIYRFFLVHLSKMFIIFINDKKLNNRKQ